MNSMSKGMLCLIIAFVLSGFSSSTFALDRDAGGVQVGPATAYPSITLSARHDDNLFRTDTDEESTLIGIVAPAVRFALQDNIKKATLDYGIEAGFHEDSSDDDYVDQKLLGVFSYNPTDRIRTELRGEYLDEHDERGTGRSEGFGGLLLDPDEWHSLGIGGLLSYGTPNATGRVEFEASYVDKEYDNNERVTFVRDRSDLDFRGTFFYRIGPKTELLFEYKQTEFDYDATAVGTPTLDSTNRDFLFGVTWDATYKTTGVAKCGYQE